MAQPTHSTHSSNSFRLEDTPYAPWEELVLLEQIGNMTANHSSHLLFTTHVGDFQKPSRTNCRESAYSKARNYLQSGPVPTFVLAGDNDYVDCPNPETAYGLYSKYFNFFENFWNHDLGVIRMEKRPEMFAIRKYGVLYIGVHLIDAKPDGGAALEEWNARMQANIDWFSQNVEDYSEGLRGVIVFGHALRSPGTRPFFVGIHSSFLSDPARFDLPILYLHGDGHRWDVDLRLTNELIWPGFRNIQVDQGAYADPCIVEVAEVVDGATVPLVAEHPLQYVFGDGLFRIDRQRGRYREDAV